MVEIFTLEPGEKLPKATGVRLIERGYSYPVEGAPPAYQQAWEQSTHGVHHYSGLADQQALCPWELKRAFRQDEFPVVEAEWRTQEGAAFTCTVRNSTERLNEANLFVLKSLISGAGMGLFLRPTPPGGIPLVIPQGRLICMYSRTRTWEDVGDMASTDYLLEVTLGGGTTARFNPEVYNGDDIGRFINQGGLLEGLEEMCRGCDRDSGRTSYTPHEVNQAIEQHCNVTYKPLRNSQLKVVAKVALTSTREPQELLSNYGIDYWLRYFLANWQRLGRNNHLTRCVMWILMSRRSAYDGPVRVGPSEVPDDLREEYADMPCPVQQLRRRRGQW